jgi:hypothetical protein
LTKAGSSGTGRPDVINVKLGTSTGWFMFCLFITDFTCID